MRLRAFSQDGCELVAAHAWQVSECLPNPVAAQLLCRESGFRGLGANLFVSKKNAYFNSRCSLPFLPLLPFADF